MGEVHGDLLVVESIWNKYMLSDSNLKDIYIAACSQCGVRFAVVAGAFLWNNDARYPQKLLSPGNDESDCIP
jgi:hypothetical protein